MTRLRDTTERFLNGAAARLPARDGHRRTLWLVLVVSVATCVLSSGVAWAVFSTGGTSVAASYTAGVLNTPAGLGSTHPDETTTIDGKVSLTWTDTLDIPAAAVTYYIFREPAATGAVSPPTPPPASPGGNWTRLASITGGTTSPATADCPASGSLPTISIGCTYVDPASSAAFNSQYIYEIVSEVGVSSWNATSAPDMALSLPPTTGTDTTASGGSSSWTQQTVGSSNFNGISAGSSSNVWAGGADTSHIASFASGTWADTQTNTGGTAIAAVSAVSSTNAWTAGGSGKVNYTTNGGTTWTAVAVTGAPNLTSVAATSSDVWVAANPSGGGGEAYHSATGSPSFTALASFAPSQATGFTALSALPGTTDVWAAEPGVNNGNTKGTWIGFWDGSSFSETRVFSASSGNPDFKAVLALDSSDVFVAGTKGTVVVCSASCTGALPTWTAQTVTGASTDTFNAIYASDASHIWVVGTNGSNGVVFTGTLTGSTWTWTNITSSAAGSLIGPVLNTISGTDANHLWIGGASGQIDSFLPGASYGLTSTDLTNLSSPNTVTYTTQAAWAAGTSIPAGGCGSGNQGVEVSFTPTIPTGLTTITTVKATTVAAASATAGIGAVYAISIFDGTSWHTQTTPSSLTTSLSTDTVDFSTNINTTTKLSSIQLCFQAVSGTSGSVKTAIDMLHVDVN